MAEGTVRIRDRRTEKRYFVDNVIVDDYGPIIGPYGLAVYNVLVRHSNADTGRNSWPSHKTIAKKAGCSVSKVKEVIGQFVELGLVAINSRYKPGKGQLSNEYLILEPPSLPPATTTPSPQGSDTPTKNPPGFKNPHSIPPPEKTEAGQPPTPKANIHRLLQATKTQGEDETPKSALAEYIGQKINPVPSGQRNDLARPYTEHLPGGEKRKHPSPDELWVSHPRFPDWVEERIKWAVGKGGSAAAQRKRAVNAVCKYKGNEWAWLDWLASQVEANPLHRFKPIDDGPSQEDIDWWEREHGGGE